jgi:hypothetical protein
MLTVLLACQLNFSTPQRITANDKPIDATIGHASPYLRDMNNDGVRDLLVAEFGDQMFDITRLPEKMQEGAAGRYEDSRLRVYLNHGSDTAPSYKDFDYLANAQGQLLSIPST